VRELPLFPLHVVLFPGRPLPLHVFEPRYRRMLADCLEGDRTFGVVAIRAGRETGDEAEIFRVGTMARIVRVEQLEDGRANLITVGTDRFQILEQLPAEPYRRAVVEHLEDRDVSSAGQVVNGSSAGEEAARLRRLLLPYLLDMGAPEDIEQRLPDDPSTLAWLAAATVQVDVPEQQRLLEMESTARRVTEVVDLLRRESGIAKHFGSVGQLRPPGPGGAQLN
jgi:Lon protease-like protein